MTIAHSPKKANRLRDRVLALVLGALAFVAGCRALHRGPAVSVSFAQTTPADEARSAIARGLEDYAAHRYAQARAEFARASRAPQGVIRGRSLYMLGLTELALGKPLKAGETLEHAADEYVVLGDYALYHAGRAAAEAGDFAAAIRILSSLRLKFFDSVWRADAARIVGLSFLALDNAVEARSALERAFREGLDQTAIPGARLALGQAHEEAGDRGSAARIYEDLWLTLPETPEADEAAKRLERLRREGVPVRAVSLKQRMGRAERLLNRYVYAQALEEYRALASEAQKSGDRAHAYRATMGAARCLFRLKRYVEATTAYRDVRLAFVGRPGVEEALFWEARSLTRQQKYEEGFATYRRLIARHGQSRWARESRFRLALLLEDRGKLDEARTEYARLIQHGAGEHRDEALWRLGWIDWKQGPMAAAGRQFHALATLSRDDALARQGSYWEARVLERREQTEDARKRYLAIAGRAPLSYYRFASEARLTVLGGGPLEDIKPLPAGPEPPGPTRSLGAHFERGLELVALRQNEDASREIGLVRPVGPDLLLYFARLLQGMHAYYESARLILSREAEPLSRSVQGKLPLLRYIYPRAYPGEVGAQATRWDLDPTLIWAIMREESTYRPAIRSPAGAVGLMQLMPATAGRLGAEAGLSRGEIDLQEPATNIALGARHLAALLSRYDGNRARALAAYNAGEEAVDRWLSEMPSSLQAQEDTFIEEIPYQETRDYVKKVLKSYDVYRRLYPTDGKKVLRGEGGTS